MPCKTSCLVAIVLFFFAFNAVAAGKPLRVHVLDVGQADCIIIESPGGKLLVVDVGEDTRRPGNEAAVFYNYLVNELNKQVIDYLLITHYHEDHLGWPREILPTGLFYLHRQAGISIRKVIDRGLEVISDSPLCQKYQEWVKASGIRRETIEFRSREQPPQIDLGDGILIDVIAFNSRFDRGRGDIILKDPEEQQQADEHNFSIVFVLHYDKFDMYFGGDISGYQRETLRDIESRFLHRLKEVEVCKVSDHGSVWASRLELIEILMPEVSIISCGRGYGMPHRETVEKLLGFKDPASGRPTGSDIYQTGGQDGFISSQPHPETGKVQVITASPIIIETDGKKSFYVKHKEIIQEYLLHEAGPYRNR
ncbi:MAG TPA: ComEC/Rec2 family competence protein [Candidatus Hypogeohydataceae bacterium YC41]